MECKKALVLGMVVLTLLMSVLVVSARHPFLGLPLLGKREARGDLACCDYCECGDNGDDTCSCYDYSVPGDTCTDGCDDCDCNDEESCRCLDRLDVCPADPCNSDYIPDDKAPPEEEKKQGEASHAQTSN